MFHCHPNMRFLIFFISATRTTDRHAASRVNIELLGGTGASVFC